MTSRAATQAKKGVALKAGVWYVISSIMVKAVSIITTPIFTRLLATTEYGNVSNFNSWYSLLLPVFTLNLTYSIGRAKLDYSDRLDDYVGSVQLLSGLIGLAITAAAILLMGPVTALLELTVLETALLLIHLLFAPAIQMVQNSYRYRYKYKQNVAIAWFTVLSTTLLSLLLIWTVKSDRLDRAVLRMIGITVPGMLLSLYFWFRAARRKHLKVNLEFWRYGLMISLPLVLHTISMHILSQSDRVFITKICGKEDTAFYTVAYTYGMLLHVVIGAVGDGWLPWFHDTYYAGHYDEIRKSMKPLVLLVCFVGLGCTALAPEAVLVLGGKKYAHAVPCVMPVVLGVVCQYIYTHYVNIELHLKKTGYVSLGTIMAAGLNIALNAIFIPKFGFVAAAYTTLAGYFSLLVVHKLITRFVLKVSIYDDLFLYGALAVTAVISYGLTLTYGHNLLRFGLVAAGFVVFLIVFHDYLKKWVHKFAKKLGRK